jgi:NAD(P)-dependent dehydrogenase (short-subunit alcohol dehydrogenase family)
MGSGTAAAGTLDPRIQGRESRTKRDRRRCFVRHRKGTGVRARVPKAIGDTAVVTVIDVSKPEEAMQRLRELLDAMTDVELFVISAGTGFENPTLEWEPEHETIAVNVTGFAAIANVAVSHLQRRGSGSLVAISSIAALRGSSGAPAYLGGHAGRRCATDLRCGQEAEENRLRDQAMAADRLDRASDAGLDRRAPRLLTEGRYEPLSELLTL